MLADAGDSGLEDANADESIANAVILKLYELKSWSEDVTREPRVLKVDEKFTAVKESERIRKPDCILRTGPKVFWGMYPQLGLTCVTDGNSDELFENELNSLASEAIHQYQE
jgi:leucyl-tRNA synthetase